MDLVELTIDELIDTGALSIAIPEADLSRIRLSAPPLPVDSKSRSCAHLSKFSRERSSWDSEKQRRTFHRHGETHWHKNRTTVPAKEPHCPGHATRQLEFPIFLKANKDGWPQVLERHGGYIVPRTRRDNEETNQHFLGLTLQTQKGAAHCNSLSHDSRANEARKTNGPSDQVAFAQRKWGKCSLLH